MENPLELMLYEKRMSPDGIDLPEGKLEVISIVEDVHQIRVKGMNVFQLGKLRDYRCQLVVIILLRVFHLRTINHQT